MLCGSNLVVRVVRSLGFRRPAAERRRGTFLCGEAEEDSSDEENDDDSDRESSPGHHSLPSYSHELQCPEGHRMRGHLPKEVFSLFQFCREKRCCHGCEEELDDSSAVYRCKECDLYYCNACAREQLGLGSYDEGSATSSCSLLPGDIFLCGPDKFGIHHVILARSATEEADPEVTALLDVPPGMEVLAVQTIESTQGSVGDETWWYPTTSFFQRCPSTGQLHLVADLPPDSRVLERASDPVPTKLLLHPFRSEAGALGFDDAAFNEVIERAAKKSRKYGKRTAVRSAVGGLVKRGLIGSLGDFPSPGDRAQLLEEIRKSWRNKPICASVAIKCWQMYFERTRSSPDEAVQYMLAYMPHWCHLSTPSAMVGTLTRCGWVLLETC